MARTISFSFFILHSSFLPGADALTQAGLAPLRLEAKEGLALLNGTHLMAAMGALLSTTRGCCCTPPRRPRL